MKDVVKEIFTAYLQKKGCRKTPERYAILEEIYSRPEHFDVEAIFVAMNKKNYRVSRATIYNTIELLLDCNLVIKHQFKNNTAQFERAYNNDRHEHLICLKCGKVEEFSDNRLDEITEYIAEKRNFSVHHRLMYVYGICKSCQAGKK
ncbi:transcriptional repressor [Odoribacter laneus]|jgi:transcriptional regulator, Fur family|uniref:Ferric uptake regulation protein n=1 Tax=Odoribacter laneus YIT 12061 TaxID=742817 RepID=H1DJB1_9BACT|nr:transcriptional repressor [Odoribacter laneus]EHP46366.1 hypothetical protein HMPREF9449_01983 [Odoribacter laneus YIT 12061]MBS1445349.1 transcriptional repressor [Odoribacter sp.]GKI21588.1 transcriptional repressor [Odoribacter laneus]GKI26170.1 transcriptional repressor [Odoribacter laneus]